MAVLNKTRYKNEADFVKDFRQVFMKIYPLGFCNKNDAQASVGIPDYTFCIPPMKTILAEFKYVKQAKLDSLFINNYTELSGKALKDMSKREFYQSLTIIRFPKVAYYFNYDEDTQEYIKIGFQERATYTSLISMINNI